MKRLVLPLIGFCLWGCTYAIKPTVTTIDTLTPGVVQTRPVGAALFEKGVTKMVPGFITRTTCYLPVMEHLVFPPLKKGTTFIPEGRLGNGDFLCTTAKFNRKNVFTDTGMPIERDVPRFIIKPQGEFRGLYFTGSGRIAEQEERLKDLFSSTEVPIKDSYKNELIYNGKNDDGMIKLTYREFSGDMTEPSFYKGLTYNIASLKLIKVKDVLIEVVEATNADITFIVKN